MLTFHRGKIVWIMTSLSTDSGTSVYTRLCTRIPLWYVKCVYVYMDLYIHL